MIREAPVLAPVLAPPPTEPRVCEALANLGAVILLGGSVGTSSVAAAARRPPCRLPIDGSTTVLSHWRQHVLNLKRQVVLSEFALRVVGNDSDPQTASASENDSELPMVLERDPAELRGTGGVLRDVCLSYPAGSFVLVASAAQLLTAPLSTAADELANSSADVAVLADLAGPPGTIMLVRCECLEAIPRIGYIDMKEQALPLIARTHRVEVVRREQPFALPLRTRADYIRALRWYHQNPRGAPVLDPFTEDWQPVFSVVEDGATVDASARLYDSVILSGGRVERGATVVRSVVCSGGVVPRNQSVIDQMIIPARCK